MRELLRHSCKSFEEHLEEKEGQMRSLEGLLENYRAAGDMFDQESQAKVLQDKMAALQDEIGACAVQKRHLEAKIARITGSGIDAQVAGGEWRPGSLKRPSVGGGVAPARRGEVGLDVRARGDDGLLGMLALLLPL